MSDQAFTRWLGYCTLWGCFRAKLIKRGEFWICPKCSASYGRNE
jgi:hypothetical protein